MSKDGIANMQTPGKRVLLFWLSTINHKDDVEVYHKRDDKNFAGHDETYFKRSCNIEVLLVSYLRMILPPCKTLGKKGELHVRIKDYHGKLVKEYRGSSRTGNRENQLSALTHRTNKNRETRGKSSANCHKLCCSTTKQLQLIRNMISQNWITGILLRYLRLVLPPCKHWIECVLRVQIEVYWNWQKSKKGNEVYHGRTRRILVGNNKTDFKRFALHWSIHSLDI